MYYGSNDKYRNYHKKCDFYETIDKRNMKLVVVIHGCLGVGRTIIFMIFLTDCEHRATPLI